jgi:Kef-type K+ transport system membrane component KefB
MELFGLILLLFAAKAGGIIFSKLRQPSVAGELIAGVILGPSVLSLVTNTPVIETMSELGLIFLILLISMSVDWRKLESKAETFAWIEITKAFLIFVAVFLIGTYIQWDFYTKVVVGLIAVLTSTAVISRTLIDLNELKSSVGEVLLSTNIMGDIFSIMIITILAGFIATSTISVEPIFTLVLLLVGFFVVVGRIGGRMINKLTTLIQRNGIEELLLAFTLVLAMLIGMITEELKLATLLGVFMTGMLLSKSSQYASASKKVKEVGESFFIPIFFASIGISINLWAVYSQLHFIAAFAVALIGIKWLLTTATFRMFSHSTEESVKIGSAMISLSELTVVIAAMAFSVTNPALLSMLIVVFVGTNMVSPFITTAVFRSGLGSGNGRYFKATGKGSMYNFRKE